MRGQMELLAGSTVTQAAQIIYDFAPFFGLLLGLSLAFMIGNWLRDMYRG